MHLPQPSLGRRERAKAARRADIKAAALAVFTEKGYEAATTREIAERAGVGAATLFRYAEDKRDLLLMIANDGLEAATAEARDAVADDAPLVEHLLRIFMPRFRYWARHLPIARETMHETVLARAAGALSREARRYLAGRAALVALIEDVVRRAQARGEVAAGHDRATVATLFLGIHLSQLRIWSAQPRPNVRRGIDELRRLLQLTVDGVGAR